MHKRDASPTTEDALTHTLKVDSRDFKAAQLWMDSKQSNMFHRFISISQNTIENVIYLHNSIQKLTLSYSI